jgi:hypothetical protein
MTETQPPITADPKASTNGKAPAGKAKADPFDPETLRLNAGADVNIEKVLTAVPVRKPKRTEFVRVHPDYVQDALVLEREDGLDKECYLVTSDVQHLVLPELRRTRLFTAITKRGTVFLWPIKLPGDDNDRFRRTADTALQAAEQAKTLWVKVAWNRDLGGYEMFRAKGDLGEPQWPDKSLRDLLEIAFRLNLIDKPDHPVIKELAGEL